MTRPAPDRDLREVVATAKRELEGMMDLNPQVMALIDHHGAVRRANRALLELTGATAFDAVLGRSIRDLLAEAPAEFYASIVSPPPGVSTREATVRLPGGRRRDIAVTTIGGSPDRVLVIQDVTGRQERLLEEERRHKREAVAALIGALMHNINQPLTVITVTVRLLQMALTDPEGNRAEIMEHCRAIAERTMDVKTMLERVRAARAFITERYLDGDTEILDLSRLDDEAPPAGSSD